MKTDPCHKLIKSENMKIEEVFSLKHEETEEQIKMAFIKEESEDMKIEEVFSLKHEETEEQIKMALIKEETEDMKIDGTFRVKHEDTEEQTDLKRHMDRRPLRNHHRKCEEKFENTLAKKDHCKESHGDEPWSPPSTPPPSREDEELRDELLSSSGSDADPLDEDFKPSPSPSSIEDELLALESQSSCHNTPEKHHSHASSSETDTREAENQKAKGKAVQKGSKSKGKGGMFKDDKKITVKRSGTKDGARVWDKVHYCVVCETAQLKIARHLERKHIMERDVAYAFSFPVGSKQRKILIEGLRNKGDWKHNRMVFEEGNGEIVVWKRPSEKADIESYLPCQHCYAMFKRTKLWRHLKSCREQNEERKNGKRVQKSSSHLLPRKSGQVQKIIHSMKQDHVSSHIRSDEMICVYGDALLAKKGRVESQHRYIGQKLRELGRFMLAAKEIDERAQTLKDICDPANFKLAIEAARHVSNYDVNKNEYGRPSKAVKIGFSLKGATEAWIGHCLMDSDVITEKAKKFKELLESSWSIHVSTNAHSSLEQRRWGKEDTLPLTEDVITLQNYLRTVEDEAKAELTERVSTTAYRKLSESLLAQIILFNNKREGEASRLTLETYLKADTGPVNKDIYETLSPVEKQMSHRLTRLVTHERRSRKVPILLLERTKASLDFLVEKRREVGILEENPFLFARLSTTSNLRGWDCLRRSAEESKAKNPELLRSTRLRKRVTAICQLLNLSNQELEQVARFMGHDIGVHCEYYRQTDKTVQVAKISKLLFAMEHGAESLKGKSLQTLDSVISGKRHAVTPTKDLKGVKKRRTSDAGIQQEDHEDGRQLSTTSSSAQRKKKTVTTQRQDDDDSAGWSLEKRPCQTSRTRQADDGNADEDDGSDNSSQGIEDTDGLVHQEMGEGQMERTAEKHDDDEKDQKGRAKRLKQSPKKSQKKTAVIRQRSDVDAPERVVKNRSKRPWNDQERTAVKRRLAKLISLKMVPGKQDCLMCIAKETPVLSARTWKDVKYFVYNEIVKVKRKLAL
ncbi:uncharacterized protein LOC127955914 isoform X3 [Carassius gibelio]|uniref:uncharacterized protein LOC127955914 isoform X3 n=1 Tax=Carassius gibelio TaxID=101364 RepID=UPI0022794F9B|nr:uncharacterized protein LOC127955914 isoform X3 [Carassius gibelio]